MSIPGRRISKCKGPEKRISWHIQSTNKGWSLEAKGIAEWYSHIHTCMHVYMHTYIHTFIHKYLLKPCSAKVQQKTSRVFPKWKLHEVICGGGVLKLLVRNLDFLLVAVMSSWRVWFSLLEGYYSVYILFISPSTSFCQTMRPFTGETILPSNLSVSEQKLSPFIGT